MAAASVRLLFVIDDPDLRSDVAARLAAHPECTVVDIVGSDEDLVAAAAASDPAAVVCDLGDDPEASLQLLDDARDLRLPIVALVQDEHDGLEALTLGARAVLPRVFHADRLIAAVRAALAGLVALDSSVAGFAPRPGRADADADAIVEPLTRREFQVLRLMAEGLANKPIAERLGITEHTTKFHVHTILGKLGTQSRTEAVVRAARLGLIAI